MKTFTFFTEKGGVGKTTLTLLFAAYLAYFLKLRVLVIDTDAPTFKYQQLRDTDIQNLSVAGNPLYNYVNKHTESPKGYYPIRCIGETHENHTTRVLKASATAIRDIRMQGDFDIALIDLPGEFSIDSLAMVLMSNHLLDEVYLITSPELQEMNSAFLQGLELKKMGVPFRILWNRIPANVLRNAEAMEKAEQPFIDAGMSFSPVRIHEFNKARQYSEVNCFVRNTVCWPHRYIQMFCPEIVSLGEEIINDLSRI